jgi:hypothetical protein
VTQLSNRSAVYRGMPSATPQIFARITKVDEERRLVYGRATEEVVDRADEIFDYKSSKPLFQKWSAECFEDSQGKSFGNVRAMHGPTAAGKLTEIDFHDDLKVIDVVSKVVDDNEWNKVLEGVYTGYSIGGGYAKRWDDIVDGKKVTRYTADPCEISLVDRPCVPTAKFFDIAKADGTTQKVMFKAFTEPTDSTSGIAGYGSGDPKKKRKKTGKSEMAEAAKCALKKGCESVSSFADLIQRMKWLSDSEQWEADFEEDNSPLPGKLKEQAAVMLALLAEMALEEAGELRAGDGVRGPLYRAAGNPSDPHSSLELRKSGAPNMPVPNSGASADPEKQPLNKGGGIDLNGGSGSPSGQEVESANAKADDPDAETAEERDERLKRRAAKKAAETCKAAGLPASKAEFDSALEKAAQTGAEAAVRMMAKAMGIDPDAASPAKAEGEKETLAKAANPAAAAPAAKRPALFAVGKDGGVGALEESEQLRKSVAPVPGDRGEKETPRQAAATLIKAIHSRGPDFTESLHGIRKSG